MSFGDLDGNGSNSLPPSRQEMRVGESVKRDVCATLIGLSRATE